MVVWCPSLAALVGLAILVSTFSVSKALRPSDGCKPLARASSADTTLTKHQIQVADYEEITRTYWLQGPPRTGEPAPLLFAFHGQTGQGDSFATSHTFSERGRQNNLMAVYPQGSDDADANQDQGTGWNCGTGGDDTTCLPTGVGTAGGCYKSCQAKNQCGKCNWSTCTDDVLFIKTILEAVSQQFCIDLDRVYAQGESNGAMMVQHLVRQLPDTFAGVATWFGTPLVGYLLGSQQVVIGEQLALARTAYLSLHGRNDTCIPPQGGVTDANWIYEPLEQSTGLFAALHHCSPTASSLETPWDGGPLNFRCAEYLHCTTGRRVIQCMYDGVHGDWPTGTGGDEITLWFHMQFSRSDPIAQAPQGVVV